MMKYLVSFLFILVQACFSLLSAGNEVEMASGMRSEGKIYVVVAVLCIVFTGIVLFLVRLERRVNKLEKEKTDL